jgi:hypothetical protein
MTYRQIVQLKGTVNNSNLALLDVTQEELAVANINSNVYWPALAPWGKNAANTGFRDRLSNSDCLASDYSAVSTRFFSTIDSKFAYSIQGFDMVLNEPDFDCSGSFTVALLAGDECGFGSISIGSGAWFLSSNLGKIRFDGSVGTSGGYDAYNGPLLSTNNMTAVILIVDRENNTVILRINGSDEMSIDFDGTATIFSELQIGAVNGGTPQMRTGHYRAPIAFKSALSGVQLQELDNYLLSQKGT